MERIAAPLGSTGRLCLLSYRILERLNGLLSAMVGGFWLAMLSREDMNRVTEASYAKIKEYRTDEHNRRGLFDWERRVIEDHFSDCHSILVAGTGGGREVLALRRRGFVADGFESHPDFVRFANELLQREGLAPDVRQAPWDGCPTYDKEYDGIVIGWGVYMHIRGRDRRVRFLKAMREQVAPGAPILLSFSAAPGQARTLRVTAAVGNVVGRIVGRPRVERGDSMNPYFIRYFTREDLEEEMKAAGFQLVADDALNHPHAVGRSL